MAIRDVFKVSRKTFINPTAWIGTDFIKAEHNVIMRVLKSIFSRPTAEREETFEEACERFNLEEKDVASMRQRFKGYAWLFASLGLLVFLYGFFLLFRHFMLTGWLLAMGAAGLFFAQAFRFDFWALQLQKRQLGLRFRDWKQHILGSKRGNHS